MRFAKTLMATAAALALSLGAAQAESHGMKLKIGTEGAYPPFNNLEADGSLVGFDIDIAKALCEEMKAECEFVTQDWDGIIPALLDGKYDAIIASMSITEERKEKVDFTNKYYTNSLIVVAPKNSTIASADQTGLEGKTIGAQSGTVGADYLADNYPNAETKVYPTQLEMYADLLIGRLDGAIGDIGVMGYFLQSDEGSCCKQIGDPFYDNDEIGIAVRKNENELRTELNKAIEKIRETGVYKTISERYFGTDIY